MFGGLLGRVAGIDGGIQQASDRLHDAMEADRQRKFNEFAVRRSLQNEENKMKTAVVEYASRIVKAVFGDKAEQLREKTGVRLTPSVDSEDYFDVELDRGLPFTKEEVEQIMEVTKVARCREKMLNAASHRGSEEYTQTVVRPSRASMGGLASMGSIPSCGPEHALSSLVTCPDGQDD